MIQKFKNHMPQIHTTCFIAPGSAIIGNVKMGEYSSVWHNAVIRGDIEAIIIGENTNVQDGCLLHCIHNTELRIGNNVSVGHGAILHSCTIGDCSLIGMGAVVLDGVKIGRNCLIGAGTVVTPNTVIPDNSLVLGSPGKVKRELTEQEIENLLKNAQEYISLSEEYKASY